MTPSRSPSHPPLIQANCRARFAPGHRPSIQREEGLQRDGDRAVGIVELNAGEGKLASENRFAEARQAWNISSPGKVVVRVKWRKRRRSSTRVQAAWPATALTCTAAKIETNRLLELCPVRYLTQAEVPAAPELDSARADTADGKGDTRDVFSPEEAGILHGVSG